MRPGFKDSTGCQGNKVLFPMYVFPVSAQEVVYRCVCLSMNTGSGVGGQSSTEQQGLALEVFVLC